MTGLGREVTLPGPGIRAKFLLGFAIAGPLPCLFVLSLGLPFLLLMIGQRRPVRTPPSAAQR